VPADCRRTGRTDVDAGAFDRWRSAHTDNSPLADEVRDVADGDRELVGYVMANTPGLNTRGERGHGLASVPTPPKQRGAVVLNRADVAPLTFGYTTT
jgi:hypothetical protein